MAENIEKLEAGSKLEPHLAQNSKVKVDWDGGIGCGNKEIQISEKLCVLLLSRRVTNKMMTLVFLPLRVEYKPNFLDFSKRALTLSSCR